MSKSEQAETLTENILNSLSPADREWLEDLIIAGEEDQLVEKLRVLVSVSFGEARRG